MPRISASSNIDSIRVQEQGTAPGTPPPGYVQIYAKSDGNVYIKDDTGAETNISVGAVTITLSADTGTDRTLTDGETLEFEGGEGIATVMGVVSGNDAVTISADVIGLATATTLINQDQFMVYDFGASAHRRIGYLDLKSELDSDLSFIGGTAGTTDNAVPRADGTGGSTLQASGVTIDDSDNVGGIVNLTATGTTTLTTIDCNGGNIDGTVIGAAAAAAGTFDDLTVDGPAGTIRTLAFTSSGSNRILFTINDAAETGSNAGSNFTMTVCDDTGASLGTALAIFRATKQVRFFGDMLPNDNSTYELGLSSRRWQKGWFTDIDSTNAVNVSSDARGKADVRTITPERGLALVLALTPRTFRRNGNPRVHMGFVAQDIESALRRTGNDSLGVVQTNTATGDKSVAYTEIIAAQAAAIQALEARISKLEQKVV